MNVQHINVTHLIDGPGKVGIVAIVAISSNIIKANTIVDLVELFFLYQNRFCPFNQPDGEIVRVNHVDNYIAV